MPVDNQIATMADLAKQSNNDVIIFSVIIIIALSVIMIPFYKMMMGNRKQQADIEAARQLQQLEREKHILEVVRENSGVITELKSMLGTSGNATNASLVRIHERIDGISTVVQNLAIEQAKAEAHLVRIEKDLEKPLQDHKQILDKVTSGLSGIEALVNKAMDTQDVKE